MARRVLFRRDYRRFFGGHLKLWDYFNHIRAIPGFEPQIYFTPESVWDETNPWREERATVLSEWRPDVADLLFLEGMDWLALDEAQRRDPPAPVINLIQHVRHADPPNKRYPFLAHPAIRICVSPEVAAALEATGVVNGPIVTIPYGIDLATEPAPQRARDLDLLIVGIKQRWPARGLYWSLRAALGARARIELLTRKIPRAAFLDRVARARVTLFLPNRTEGFYLPALEGMALGTLVVCPDCVGNRGFCLPDENCLRPPYRLDRVVAATLRALRMPPARADEMRARARSTAEHHTLAVERARLRPVLTRAVEGWRQEEHFR